MRNYFRDLQLPLHADTSTIKQALDARVEIRHPAPEKYRQDMDFVLTDASRFSQYTRSVQLYEALYLASDCLDSADATDTHRWRDRLAAFATLDDDLTLL